MVDIKQNIENINQEIINIRRDFHRNPELSDNEFGTMEKICDYLESWGIEYKKGVAKTGVVAIIPGKETGKTIGIRADIDALPVTEQTGLPFASINKGVMHACGHDAHITIALGAAKVLNSMKKDIKGNIKFFFQPAEETIGGAERMIQEGCLEDPDVDVVLGLHVSPNIETGSVELRYGKMNASSDMITIVVRGKSAHGANPEKSIDPLVISANIILGLQTIVSRNISPLNPAVFTIGSINGGTKGNIIPEEVKMECILRTLDNETRSYFKERIINIVEGISKSYGGEGEVIIQESYAPLINTDEIVDIVKEVAEEVVGKDNIRYIPHPELFAEDFSYFAQEKKACFFHLGCRNKEKDCIYPLHNSKFNIDEDCLKLGVELQVKNVIKLLGL